LRINPLLRRLITRLIAIIPALIVNLIYGETKVDALLVMSQVVLSMQLGFAIIPLIHFVSDKSTMGKFVIPPLTKTAAWIIAAALIYLNIKMLVNEAMPVFQTGTLFSRVGIVFAGIFFGGLLLYIILFPMINKRKLAKSIDMHEGVVPLTEILLPTYNKIAVALDFSKNDPTILSAALGQGSQSSKYLLLHIVESASAKLLGNESDDYETRRDRETMNNYVAQLNQKGYSVTSEIGFRNRVKEIVRIVKESKADMLVIGAHGHKGLKDILYGATVNAVRHELKIPVLVVTL
jgi:manganese transport protein